jgi:D-alanyl-D-alanine carboxypeptidase
MHRFNRTSLRNRSLLFVSILELTLVCSSAAQTDLTPALRASVDDIARKILATTGVPSASLVVVKNGQIAYLQAYGDARLDHARLPSRQ